MADLTSVPRILTAGDSYTLTLTYSDYPASSGWQMALAVAGPSVASWTSSASGAAHVIAIPAANTTTLAAGLYEYRVRAVRSGVVETIARGTLTVEADLGAVAPGERTSWVETTLKVVESALSNTLTGEMKMYMIGGRQVMTFTPAELMRLRTQLRTELSIARGIRPAGGTIQTVFTRR